MSCAGCPCHVTDPDTVEVPECLALGKCIEEEELLEDILALIEERQRKKDEIDALDEERKALDARIEELSGPGTNHHGTYSVTVQDIVEERFDSTRFKKENPELAAKYTDKKPKHVFRIQILKAERVA